MNNKQEEIFCPYSNWCDQKDIENERQTIEREKEHTELMLFS